MVWRSEVEIDSLWDGLENLTRVKRAFYLSEFVTNVVYTRSFVADETWSESIVISEAGRSLLAEQPEVWNRFPQAELHLAVLGKFFHQDLLIDCDKSDLDQAERAEPLSASPLYSTSLHLWTSTLR
jgi:hypothetical protein